VAVAEIRAPAAVAGSGTSKEAFPDPSVVACAEPRYVSPSTN